MKEDYQIIIGRIFLWTVVIFATILVLYAVLKAII